MRTACTQILCTKNFELFKLKNKKGAGAMCSITGECKSAATCAKGSVKDRGEITTMLLVIVKISYC